MPEEETLAPIIEPSRWGAEIAAAFVAAQGEMDAITKDRQAKVEMKTGGSYSYSYADLATIQDDIRSVLAKHHLAHSQDVVSRVNNIDVYTMLVHKSGQAVTFGPMTFPAGSTPQNAGSAVTYARRYSLLAAVGLATEDDDGQSAAARTGPSVERSGEPVTAAQLTATAELAERVKNTHGPLRDEIDAIGKKYGRGTSKAAFGADPAYAAEVEALLNGAAA